MTLVLKSNPIYRSRIGGFRHLVYFIDGTWLFAGSDKNLTEYSNIYIMNTLLEADDHSANAQISYYSRGLGATYGPRKYTAGGFSYGIREQVQDIYINICSNYEPGDKIYIFGFSRGAVVARAVIDLLSFGILNPHSIYKLPDLWNAYSGSGLVSLPDSKDGGRTLAEDFADQNPTIEFVGLFDTVSGGRGITNTAQRLRLHQRPVNGIVNNAVHILALDESRKFFQPVLWTKGHEQIKHFEQIWMPGVHSDIGGAYRERSLGNASLVTMIDRVIHRTKLSFNLKDLVNRYNFNMSQISISNEYSKFWKYVQVRDYSRTLDRGQGEYSVHTFAKWLDGQRVQWKSERDKNYTLGDAFKSHDRVAPWFLSNHFAFHRNS
ncbi:phospholipase effector Tle1 domain-containing protein [Methylobacterium radiotolerans]|uniref:phospholipase effector Tle1 domain-containing protein n=1 Tax=Methylobacterium radiotolerans TaxID=31998 RepID=UPI001F2754C3|nr:DUF2235 domain-containing protein [Methylobacterium radiotolerans]UIY45302.1 DUF2235 domain-containing protein [Methylobacterium radiotolerans]